MITHSLVQGSAEWLAHRRQFFNASDAPAMMGCSPYKTRDQLLHEMHTGLTQEVDGATQRRFDDGHRYEAMARPHAAAIIGETLYPVTGSEGKLSASFDGLTVAEDVAFEHKTLNADLRAAIRQEGGNANDFLALAYRVQMEQQLMVSGAEKVLFVASKWDGDTLEELRHCWYTSDPALRAQIAAGWEQFDADLCAYEPPAAAPLVVAEPVQALPAVSIRVNGSIAVINNFDAFEAAVRDFIDNRLIRSPQTDQDFATLEQQIKAIKGAREAVKSGMAQMRAQIEPVDTASKRAELVDKLLQTNQSMAEKLLSSEKDNRKRELLVEAQKKLGDHLRSLNERLGRDFMPQIPADFAGAIYGKKSLDSMRSAVNSTLSNAKIDANTVADKIQRNLKVIDTKAKDHGFLFNDLATQVLMDNDHFALMVDKRIGDHKAETDRKEKETRARILKETQDKMAESQIEGIRQQVIIASLGRAGVRKGGTIECIRDTLAETEAWVIDEAQFFDHVAIAQAAKTKAVSDIRALLVDAEHKAAQAAQAAQATTAPAPAAAPAVDPAMAQVRQVVAAATPPVVAAAPRPQAKPDTPPSLSLGQIGTRLGFNLTAAFLTSLGFEGEKVKGAVLFHEHQFTEICDALDDHIVGVRGKYRVTETA